MLSSASVLDQDFPAWPVIQAGRGRTLPAWSAQLALVGPGRQALSPDICMYNDIIYIHPVIFFKTAVLIVECHSMLNIWSLIII